VAIGTRHLGNGLEAEDTAATELPEARERVLEAIDGTQCVELVDHEPHSLVALPA